ncbi:1-acyl-sn-glycerol-3-phosphate acyltransferase [Carboxylicivirga sp. RSCT41]|uniref:1-acyl-sn-glycerol-3-phosphate acyltransferase n=1 Tax=Carboxylicivirga agarovorans TaxID=3417570 RepID=UPI003D34C603
MVDLNAIMEDMRPYNDAEVKEAMARMLEKEEFKGVLNYVFPEMSIDEAMHLMREIDSTNSFQEKFSSKAVDEVLNKTATQFTYSGIENIRPDESYLFISNHRDIVMDSAILQNILFKNGHRTSQITFGSNLMSSQFIVDIGKVNKMFTFFRGGTRNEIYQNALVHSAYIRKVIGEIKESIWIAQRDGRTKDGNDQTQVSLLKMLTIKQKDNVAAIRQFNIVPITISYEYEPCDVFKVCERIKSKEGAYKKSKDEDFISVLTGITEFKGRVHFAFGKPVNQFIDANISELNNCNIHEKVCEEMDRQIHSNYQLNKINYYSYDVLIGKHQFLGEHYQREDQAEIEAVLSKKIAATSDVDKDEVRKLLIELYAAPVENFLKHK